MLQFFRSILGYSTQQITPDPITPNPITPDPTSAVVHSFAGAISVEEIEVDIRAMQNHRNLKNDPEHLRLHNEGYDYEFNAPLQAPSGDTFSRSADYQARRLRREKGYEEVILCPTAYNCHGDLMPGYISLWGR